MKKIQLKQRSLFPVNVHDIRNGCVLDIDFMANGEGYLEFDGVDDKVSVPSSPSLKPTSITIVADFVVDSINGLGTIVRKYTSAGYILRIEGDKVNVYIKNSGGTSGGTFASGTVIVGQRTFLVVSFDETTGKITSTINNGSAEVKYITATPIINDDGPFYIGSNNGGEALDAKINSVRIFSGVLTEEQETDLYENGLVPPNCGAEWLFEGGEAKDTSGNDNHGTITGAIPQFVTYDQSHKEPYIWHDGVDDVLAATLSPWDLTINLETCFFIDFEIESMPSSNKNILNTANRLDVNLEANTGYIFIWFYNEDGTHSMVKKIETNFAGDGRHQLLVNKTATRIEVYLDDFENEIGGLDTTKHTFLNNNSAVMNQVNGKLYALEIFKESLTEAQRISLKNGGYVGIERALSLSMLKGAIETIVYDRSDAKFNMTKSGAEFCNQPNNGIASNVKLVQGMGDLKGAEFNKINSGISIQHDNSQLLTEGFTIVALINPKSYGAVAGDIIDKSTSTNGQNGFSFDMSSAGNILRLGVNNGTRVESGADVPYGEWTPVVVTVAPDSTVTFYIDGEVSGTPGVTGALSGITTINELKIGNRSNSTDRTFDGRISITRIYNKVFTANEAKNLTLFFKKKAGLI